MAASRGSGRALRWAPSLITAALLSLFFAYCIQQVKVQEGYWNSHAFRMLEVASRQLKAEIKGARDTVVASEKVRSGFSVRNASEVLSEEAKQALASSKAMGKQEPRKAEEAAKNAEADAYLAQYIRHAARIAPRIELMEDPGEVRSRYMICCRDASSSYMFRIEVDYRPDDEEHSDKEKPSRRTVDIDASKMLARILGSDYDDFFDGVVLATADGFVIAKGGNSSLNIRDIETLLQGRRDKRKIENPAQPDGQKAAGGGASKEPSERLIQEFSGADERVEIELSGKTYVLYLAPTSIPIAIDTFEPPVRPLLICGLVSKAEIEAKIIRLPSLAIPLGILGLVLVLSILWPLLKLYTMSPKERLRSRDLAGIYATTFLILVTMSTLFLGEGTAMTMEKDTDQRLVAIARSIQCSFAADVQEAMCTGRAAVRIWPKRPM